MPEIWDHVFCEVDQTVVYDTERGKGGTVYTLLSLRATLPRYSSRKSSALPVQYISLSPPPPPPPSPVLNEVRHNIVILIESRLVHW